MSKIRFTSQSAKNLHRIFTRFEHDGHDLRRVFDDFLVMSICALSGGAMEQQYLEVAGKWPRRDGEKIGEGLIDLFPRAFAILVEGMENEKCDVLGDFFMRAISHGHNGQYFTPDPVCNMMAEIVEPSQGERIADFCCGSGRMFLAAAKKNPNATFVGKDIDLRCVQMCTINLALNGLKGFVIWGNGLTDEQNRVYQTGFNGQGFVKEIDPELHRFCPTSAANGASLSEMGKRSNGSEQLSLFIDLQDD